ncbi:MAG: Spy/CpxP family protein refolding chaperone [Betaproteobacteria bacterium]
MNRNTLRNTLIAASLACALPFAVQAEPGGPMPGAGMPPPHHGAMPFEGPGHHGMFRGIKLSEEQQDKLFSIMHAAAPTMHEQMKALRKAQEELRTLARAPRFDEAAAQRQADTIARATAELAMLRVRTERQGYELLTPEQRKQLAEAPAKAQGPR